jgi:hypothetical protein
MYNFKRTNFVELYNLFLDTDWGIVTECNDVNIACDNLYKIINSYFDKTVPSSFGKRESFPEWFSAGTKAFIKIKKHYLKMLRSTKIQFYSNKFKEFRKKVKQSIKKDFREYILSLNKNLISLIMVIY